MLGTHRALHSTNHEMELGQDLSCSEACRIVWLVGCEAYRSTLAALVSRSDWECRANAVREHAEIGGTAAEDRLVQVTVRIVDGMAARLCVSVHHTGSLGAPAR